MDSQKTSAILDNQEVNEKTDFNKYIGATAFMEALEEAGVSCIFANLGSDHPAIIESWAQGKLLNKKIPEIIICSL